jgi:hypothetical protein
MAVEAYFTSGPFSASVEAVDNDDADTTATAITVTYAFTGDWELGARMEDDDAGTETLTIGVNKYVSGHDVKWQVNMQSIDDDVLGDTDTISVGLAVGF